VEQLGIDGMTKDRVSAICWALDQQVELFRGRPLEGAYPYPYLWLDAKMVKVRDQNRVVPKALVVAYAPDRRHASPPSVTLNPLAVTTQRVAQQLPDEIATRSPLARSWKAFETALDQLITATAIKTT
jgi:hypothetical protein